MTLRDYFAAKAMQSLLVSIDTYPDEHWRESLAVDAYWMADAMLRMREVKLQAEPAEAGALYSEEDEARMDIVGQNGNTAEHYEQILEDTQGGGHD